MTSKIEEGGSLLIAWQLRDRRVLIVGGGEVASQRLVSVLCADALITLIAPRKGLHPTISKLLTTSPRITYNDRTFRGIEDLEGIDMVLTAIDDSTASHEICSLCRTLHIPVNVADVPPSCDFYFGSQVRRGPLQIMISTNGNGPKLANVIKRRIENVLPQSVGAAVENVGLLRKRLRQRTPGAGGNLARRRMKWMSSICETWSLDDLASLDEDTMEHLLDRGWERNTVPRPDSIIHRPWLSLPRFWPVSEFGPYIAGLVAGTIATTTVIFVGQSRFGWLT